MGIDNLDYIIFETFIQKTRPNSCTKRSPRLNGGNWILDFMTGLHKMRHPGILAARKWRENKKIKRKWRENEEMKSQDAPQQIGANVRAISISFLVCTSRKEYQSQAGSTGQCESERQDNVDSTSPCWDV